MLTCIALGFAIVNVASSSSSFVNPPTTAASNTTADCTAWQIADATDTCASIAQNWGITVSQFASYNPSVGSNCTLVVGNYYCTEQRGLPPPTTTPTTTPTPTNGITTPTPTQSGMVGNCNKFYFVAKNDGCWDIAANFSISLDQFYAWNPFIGTGCKRLWPDNYVCVGVIGFTPTPTQTPTKTTPTNGIITPSPVQSGIASNCNSFYFVKKGDGCWAIAQANGITLDQFNAWNPFVGVDCAKLWPDTYVCVRVIGFKPTPTTTKPGNGIATPSPTQSGMTPNCKKFYKVVTGDGCWAIANSNNIALGDFYKWNPAVGTSCGTLWPDYYVCVGV